MNILISLLGSTLDDRGRGSSARWDAWRPSVALAMQEELQFDRYYLIYQQRFQALCDRVVQDIRTCSPA